MNDLTTKPMTINPAAYSPAAIKLMANAVHEALGKEGRNKLSMAHLLTLNCCMHLVEDVAEEGREGHLFDGLACDCGVDLPAVVLMPNRPVAVTCPDCGQVTEFGPISPEGGAP